MIVDIIRYGNNGEGIAINNGKIVFVKGALVGETVDVALVKDSANFCIAKINKILKQSPQRQTPVCHYFKNCGGCQLQHICYAEQLKVKQQKIIGNLKKYANCVIPSCNIVSSPKILEYRNHMRFAVFNNKLSLRKNNSHDCVNIGYCYIAYEAINLCIEPLNCFLEKTNLDIDEVDIKAIEKQILITFICEKDIKKIDITHLKSMLSPYFTYGFSLYIKDKKQIKHLEGIKEIQQKRNLTNIISPLSFLQVNNEIADRLYNDVCDLVDDEIVIDAFSGRGLLSCIVSKKAKKVYAIEIEKSSVVDAKNMKVKNNINNVEFILGDVNEVLNNINIDFDCLILDPPRAGIKQNLVDTILKSMPNKIIYVSCACNTLARDLKGLLNKYSLKHICAYDMFPQTDEVETLVLLEKKYE